MSSIAHKRAFALSEPSTGPVGETRVIAELLRGGLRVARPMWDDEATDLIVFIVARGLWMPLRIQVKSVQLTRSADAQPLEGLKKKHLEEDPSICLAIYRLDKDAIWFIDGAANIRRAYDGQAASNPRYVAYEALGGDDEVRLQVLNRPDALAEWLVPREDPTWIARRVQRVADELADDRDDEIRRRETWDEEEGSEMESVRRTGEESGREPGEDPDIFDWIAARRPGVRDKDDVDRQIAEERASWGDG